MMIEDEDITDVFLDYFNEEISPSDETKLKEYLASSEENRDTFRQMREIWIAVKAGHSDRYDARAAFSRFKQTVKKPKEQNRCRQILRYSFAAIASAVVILFSFKAGELKLKNGFEEIVVEAPLGSTTRLILPDSTVVWLNAGSKIRYSQGFGVSERVLSLSGEGHFEVAKNPDMPFYVKTSDLELKVVGTVFDFRNYDKDLEAIVSLEEGKVTLHNNVRQMQEVFLAPNQQCVLDKSSGSLTIKKTVATNSSKWMEGRLFFDEKSLPDIVEELSRSYDVSIIIENPDIKKYSFFGDFSKREIGVDEIIESICATKKIHFRKEGDTIILF